MDRSISRNQVCATFKITIVFKWKEDFIRLHKKKAKLTFGVTDSALNQGTKS